MWAEMNVELNSESINKLKINTFQGPHGITQDFKLIMIKYFIFRHVKL